jgi:transcriptional regulator with GAF, ATPase, and Fis domain
MRLEAFASGIVARTLRVASDEQPARFVGDSDAFLYMRFRLEQVAATDATVLLLGETGTGKGLAAHEIHHLGSRRDAPFVNVDCASLPATLVESELFGRERGAFTDARATQAGRFELAHGGTIFLDEIGELPPDAQAKLLRILQCGEFERLGSPRTMRVDVRVIAATNRILIDEVKAGRFRRDLYYRLNVFPLTMPPLRQRRSDIPALTQHLIKRLGQRHHRHIDTIPRPVLDTLIAYDWPGNVRELENVLERAHILAGDGAIGPEHVVTAPRGEARSSRAAELLGEGFALDDLERELILAALARAGGSKTAAARLLGVTRRRLYSLMASHGLEA